MKSPEIQKTTEMTSLEYESIPEQGSELWREIRTINAKINRALKKNYKFWPY
ncbi:22804_t:CDS:2 [Gigaspora rosea]|nr:22804_t:CDS:2 [Gigaspora rosea]